MKSVEYEFKGCILFFKLYYFQGRENVPLARPPMRALDRSSYMCLAMS